MDGCAFTLGKAVTVTALDGSYLAGDLAQRIRAGLSRRYSIAALPILENALARVGPTWQDRIAY